MLSLELLFKVFSCLIPFPALLVEDFVYRLEIVLSVQEVLDS
jgi:hypothetical protein